MSSGADIGTTLAVVRSAWKHSDFWSDSALLWIKKVLGLLLLYVNCVHVDFSLYSLMTVKCNVCWGLHHSPFHLAKRRVRYTLAIWTLLELAGSNILPGGLLWRKWSTWSAETKFLCSFVWCHLGWDMWHPHGVHTECTVTDCAFFLPLQHVSWHTWVQLPCSSFSTISVSTGAWN